MACTHPVGTVVDPADPRKGTRCDTCGLHLSLSGDHWPYPVPAGTIWHDSDDPDSPILCDEGECSDCGCPIALGLYENMDGYEVARFVPYATVDGVVFCEDCLYAQLDPEGEVAL